MKAKVIKLEKLCAVRAFKEEKFLKRVAEARRKVTELEEEKASLVREAEQYRQDRKERELAGFERMSHQCLSLQAYTAFLDELKAMDQHIEVLDTKVHSFDARIAIARQQVAALTEERNQMIRQRQKAEQLHHRQTLRWQAETEAKDEIE